MRELSLGATVFSGVTPRTRWVLLWRTFTRQRLPFLAMCGLLGIGLISIASGTITFSGHGGMSVSVLEPPSSQHPFGTDYLGRDVMTRVVLGIRTSLAVGIAVAIVAMSVGLFMGSVAGYFGGWIDHSVTRLADALLIMPGFFLALVVAYLFGSGVVKVILLLGLTGWPQAARITRAEVLALKRVEFVDAAKAVGSSEVRIIFRHIIPNVLPALIAMAALLASYGILSEASLSFLGVGDPGVISLGRELAEGLEYATTAWWVPTFPGAAIFILVLQLNLVMDGVSLVLNPMIRSKVLG